MFSVYRVLLKICWNCLEVGFHRGIDYFQDYLIRKYLPDKKSGTCLC